MNEEQIKIWFAGFYEGEGSVSNDKSNNNKLRLSISQNDKTPLIIAKDKWGGIIRERTRKSPASDKICHGYEWRIGHKHSVKFLEDIRPFMIIPYKINQMENVLKISQEKYIGEYKCNHCDKIYANPAGRRRHEKSVHINQLNTNASENSIEFSRDGSIAGNSLEL